MTMNAMSDTARAALEKILALRQLSKDTGMQTTRSQNELLGKLDAEDLAQVALALQAQPGKLSESAKQQIDEVKQRQHGHQPR